jgi:hypothetical protein
MNPPERRPVMYIPEYTLGRIRARVAQSERWLRDNCPEFEMLLITKSERGRRQLKEDLWSVSEFQIWDMLRGFL